MTLSKEECPIIYYLYIYRLFFKKKSWALLYMIDVYCVARFLFIISGANSQSGKIH